MKLWEEALALKKAKFGPEHAETLASMYELADKCAALGRHEDALKLRKETLAICNKRLEPDFRNEGTTWSYLADNFEKLAKKYTSDGRHAGALKLREEVLAISKSRAGPGEHRTIRSMWAVADSFAALGRIDDAQRLYEESLAVQKIRVYPNALTSGRLDGDALLEGQLEVTRRLVRLGRATAAVTICRQAADAWEERRDSNKSDFYNAACVRAVLAETILSADKSPERARHAEAEADRAMALLEKAVAAGYENGGHMAGDRDLDALRGRDDFKDLLVRVAEAHLRRIEATTRQGVAIPEVLDQMELTRDWCNSAAGPKR